MILRNILLWLGLVKIMVVIKGTDTERALVLSAIRSTYIITGKLPRRGERVVLADLTFGRILEFSVGRSEFWFHIEIETP